MVVKKYKFLVNKIIIISMTVFSVTILPLMNNLSAEKNNNLVIKVPISKLSEDDKKRITLVEKIFRKRGFDGAKIILQGEASKTKKPKKGAPTAKSKSTYQKKIFDEINPDKNENYTVLVSQYLKEYPGRERRIIYRRIIHPTIDVNEENEGNKSLITSKFQVIIKDMFDIVQSKKNPTSYVRFYIKNAWYRAYIIRIDGYLSSYTTPTIAILVMGVDLDEINKKAIVKPILSPHK